MYDVLIIGCGITGAAAAFALSRYRLSIAVLERENDVSMGATKANSAILHAGYDPEPGTLMARLNLRGVELARPLCRDLDVPYRACGSLVAAFSPEERAVLEALCERGKSNGVPGLELLTGAEARTLEPELSEAVIAALHAPSAAVCSPWEYCLALAETAVRNGADLRLETAVTGLQRTEAGWRVQTDRGTFEARFVVNAAGVSADAVHDMAAPHAFDILPVRGQYFLLDKSEGVRVSRVIFQTPTAQGKGVLVAPTVHGNLLAGPTAEDIADGADTATTAAGLALVRERAALGVADIPFGAVITSFAGNRAHSSRGDFLLSETAPGFFDAAGIESPGLSAAPAIGRYVAERIASALGAALRPDFDPIRRAIPRPAQMPDRERAALIREDPRYGDIVCRCEQVSEGEILEAIRRGARSLDGVKRRVRAGMGRCQGGFCTPRVLEILARELGISPDEVCKNRPGSRLLTGTMGEADHENH